MLTESIAVDSCRISEEIGPHATSVHRFLKAVAAWRLRCRQRAQLYALGDRTLKDIGVSRCEIESIISSPIRDASGRVR